VVSDRWSGFVIVIVIVIVIVVAIVIDHALEVD
jgi:hypothetical protein